MTEREEAVEAFKKVKGGNSAGIDRVKVEFWSVGGKLNWMNNENFYKVYGSGKNFWRLRNCMYSDTV